MGFLPERIPQCGTQRLLPFGGISSVHLSSTFAAKQDDGSPWGRTGTNEGRHDLKVSGLLHPEKAELPDECDELVPPCSGDPATDQNRDFTFEHRKRST
jgi:hypothetical protein